MDDSPVQTALCVIGHPIAGNPAQFCISRILQSLEMDWQCLSFDVPPETLGTAIAGIDVLHFAGALIAPPHQSAVAKIVRDQQKIAVAASGPLPSPALPSPALPQAAADSAGDAATTSEHSAAAIPTDPVEPTDQNRVKPAPWCDALARDADGRWQLCNFVGDTLLQLIREHEQRIGVPFSTCVFLGDRATFESLMTPFKHCLPETTYCLGATTLERWPHDQTPTEAVKPNLAQQSTEPDSGCQPDAATPHRTDDDASAESAQPTVQPNPLHSPILLIRPQSLTFPGKKPGSKPAANQDLVESLLEELHPQSLVVHLAPPGVPWPILRGQGDSPTARINPIDLEVGRIAAALHRWTGHTVDRDALAEAIEEYLEI